MGYFSTKFCNIHFICAMPCANHTNPMPRVTLSYLRGSTSGLEKFSNFRLFRVHHSGGAELGPEPLCCCSEWSEYIHQNRDLTKLCTPTIYFLLYYFLRRCVSKFITWKLITLCADGMITLLLLSVQMWTQRILCFSMATKNNDFPRLILMICLKSQPWVVSHKTWRSYDAKWGFLSCCEANEFTWQVWPQTARSV